MVGYSRGEGLDGELAGRDEGGFNAAAYVLGVNCAGFEVWVVGNDPEHLEVGRDTGNNVGVKGIAEASDGLGSVLAINGDLGEEGVVEDGYFEAFVDADIVADPGEGGGAKRARGPAPGM